MELNAPTRPPPTRLIHSIPPRPHSSAIMPDDAFSRTQHILRTYVNDTRAFLPSAVRLEQSAPSPLAFARGHLRARSPFVCANATPEWRAHVEWRTKTSFIARCLSRGIERIDVNVAPFGRGDAAVLCADGVASLGAVGDEARQIARVRDLDRGFAFVEPERRNVRVEQFVHSLSDGKEEGKGKMDVSLEAAYASTQNDNARREFAAMVGDIGEVSFAREGFGCDADAVNIWIGDETSSTTWHRDFYENVYTVVTGMKIFWLRPPCDYAFMRYEKCVRGKFEWEESTKTWAIRAAPHESAVEWSVVDVDSEGVPSISGGDDSMTYATVAGEPAPPAFRVEVRAGETLYLPAMWYHRVQQRGFTIAVNHWYDMAFDDRFTSANFVNAIYDEFKGRDNDDGGDDAGSDRRSK